MGEEIPFEALFMRLRRSLANQSAMQDDDYLYDHLAEYLYIHGNIAELKSLFADHHWLHARVRQYNGSYDAYLKDLSFAWMAANDAATQQIEAHEEPLALADCVRYLLLRASINSLVRDTVPELVIQALELGLWEPQRVLSLVRVETDKKKQANFCLQLLRTDRLDQEQQREVQQLGLQAALAIEYIKYRVNALSDLVPYLPDDLIEPVLSFALGMEYSNGDENVKIFAALAPRLQEDTLERALKVALDIAYEDTQAMAVCALAPYLSEERRAGILKSLVDASEEIWHDDFGTEKAKVLRTLAPCLTGELLEQAVAMTCDVGEGRGDVDVRCALVPHLPEPQRIKAVEAMLQMTLSLWESDQDEYGGVLQCNASIRKLMLLLPAERRTPFLEQALQKTLALTDIQNRAMELVELLPCLPENGLVQAVRQALADFQAVKLDSFHTDDICSLLTYLPENMFEAGLRFTIAIEDERYRANALAALIPHLTEALLQRAMQAALAIIGDWEECARPLTALVPQLRGEQQTLVIKHALKAILSRDDDDRARYLTILMPYMTAELLERELRFYRSTGDEALQMQAISALSIYLPEEQRTRILDRELRETRNMIHSWERANALKALAQHAPQACFEQLLQAMRDLVPEYAWLDIWVAMAPKLSETHFKRIIRMIQHMKHEWDRAHMLKSIIPLLPRKLHKQVLSAAFDFEFDRDRVEVLVVLAPYLTDAQFEQIRQVAISIEQDEWRARLLCALAPRLAERDFKQAMDVDFAGGVLSPRPERSGEKQKRALAQFEAQSSQKEQIDQAELQWFTPQASEMPSSASTEAQLAQAWQAAQAVEDPWQRAQALARILPPVGENATLLKDIRTALVTALQLSGDETYSQQKVLQLLTTQELFAPPVLAVEMLAAIIASIDEICRRWEWQ